MKKELLLIIFLFVSKLLFAQQFPVISEYMFNGLILNPAYAGSREYLNASLLHRSQWMGIKGSPSTQLFSLDGQVAKNVGLGLNLGNDHTGVSNQTDILGSVSYNVGGSGFSFGLRGGVAYYQASLSKPFVWQTDDPVFSNDIASTFLPKFGFGVYYSNGTMYAGLSAPDILIVDPSKVFISYNSSRRNLKNNYLFTAGYSYMLTDKIFIEPSTLVRFHPPNPLMVDLNCNIKFGTSFLAGVSYRVNNAFVALLQLKVMDKVKVGYAFDLYQSNVKLNYFGTHEIMVSYNLGND